MKKLLLLALLAFHCIGASAQEKPTLVDTISQVSSHTIAVYTSEVEGVPSLNPMTSQIILSLKEDYTIVNRDKEFLRLIDKELGYQTGGRVDDGQLVKIGKEFGLDFICAVLAQKFDTEYYFEARIIQVEKGCVVSIADATSSDVSLVGQRKVGSVLAQGLKRLPPEEPEPIVKYSRKDLLYNEGMAVCDYMGNELSEYDVLAMLYRCENPEVLRLYSSAMDMDGSRATDLLFSFGGGLAGGAIVLCISWAIYPEDKDIAAWAGISTAASCGLLVSAIILKSLPKKRLTKALKMYNNEIRNSPYYSPSLSFGSTSYGIGLCLKF